MLIGHFHYHAVVQFIKLYLGVEPSSHPRRVAGLSAVRGRGRGRR